MRSYTLTLTSGNTVYKIDDLIKAINSRESAGFGEIGIQADSANATEILLGGANLSSTVYGVRLDPGDSWTDASGSSRNTSSTLGLYAYGVTTAGMKLHITLLER